MFAIPWYTILLLSIPQTLLIIKIGFELFNVKVELRKAILISIIIAFCTYFLRQLPLLGFHTVILVLLLTGLATAICKIRWWDSGFAIIILIRHSYYSYAFATILASLFSSFLISPAGYRLLNAIDNNFNIRKEGENYV